MKKYGFFIKTDKTEELLGITLSLNKDKSTKYFSQRKQLSVDDFLSIYQIKEIK